MIPAETGKGFQALALVLITMERLTIGGIEAREIEVELAETFIVAGPGNTGGDVGFLDCSPNGVVLELSLLKCFGLKLPRSGRNGTGFD